MTGRGYAGHHVQAVFSYWPKMGLAALSLTVWAEN